MKKIIEHLDPILLGGVVGSIAISAWLWMLSVTSPATSTIIALLGIIITLQIDHAACTEKNRTRGVSHERLIKDMESLPWIEEFVVDVIKSCKKIFDNPSHQYFYSQTKQQLFSCKNYIQEIERGYLKTDYNDVLPECAYAQICSCKQQ